MEKETTVKIKMKGTNKYKKNAKQIGKYAKKTAQRVEQLNEAMTELIELRKKLL